MGNTCCMRRDLPDVTAKLKSVLRCFFRSTCCNRNINTNICIHCSNRKNLNQELRDYWMNIPRRTKTE